MKVKIPFLGFVEKTINADFAQAFLQIFRDTQDKHRVLIIVPLVLLLSHSYYMYMQPHISVIFYKIAQKEGIWLALAGFTVLFVFFWAIFSSPFNPSLYVRQIIFAVWTGLLHRLGYGLETLGSTYITVVSFIFLTLPLIFAFTGLTVSQFFNKIKDDYQAKKNAEATEPAVISIPKANTEAA